MARREPATVEEMRRAAAAHVDGEQHRASAARAERCASWRRSCRCSASTAEVISGEFIVVPPVWGSRVEGGTRPRRPGAADQQQVVAVGDAAAPATAGAPQQVSDAAGELTWAKKVGLSASTV